MANWRRRFIEAAKFFATWSKDSTQVGAVIYNPVTKAIVSVGYNGFPRGVNDNILYRHERPAKYLFTVHAETNAIYNAARCGTALDGMGIALDWFPCAGCAGAIIQSGITEVSCTKEPDFNDERWGENFKVSWIMLEEAGIRIITDANAEAWVAIRNNT